MCFVAVVDQIYFDIFHSHGRAVTVALAFRLVSVHSRRTLNYGSYEYFMPLAIFCQAHCRGFGWVALSVSVRKSVCENT